MITYFLIALSALSMAEYERRKDGRTTILPDWNLLDKCKSRFTEFLIRVPFSFLRDPWHFLKSLSIALLMTAFVIKAGQSWIYVVYYYTGIGTIFNIRYNWAELTILFRRK